MPLAANSNSPSEAAAESESTPLFAVRASFRSAPSALRAAITAAYRRDERKAVRSLLAEALGNDESKPAIRALAQRLVQSVRQQRTQASGVDALMHEFSLSSEEGIALMCVAEALLRIPDRDTANRLIADKIGKGDWRRHLGESPSLFVNAAAWGLLVTGKLVESSSERGLGSALTRLIAKGGAPLVRKGMDLAMRMLGNQFVTGQTIEEALSNSRAAEARGYRYSYDMLGEAALTEFDASSYYDAYETAIHAIGRASNRRGVRNGPGISVKLSALHPRYSRAQRKRVMLELLPRLKQLATLAKQYDIGLNIDAEEADRLELSLDLIEALAFDPDLAGFDGIGFVVQAYQKRCPFVIDYLIDLACRSKHRFMVRLVKGAYWDAEIKRAQVDGMDGYPVYTRKDNTDASYLVCARKLLAAGEFVYPQFATHNAQSLAAVATWAREGGITDYEFQCLHGMGEALYDRVVGKGNLGIPCRIYAPVGSHRTLLAYLVRRLLENGANSSFVNRIVDDAVPIEALIADPFDAARRWDGEPHPAIPLPADLFGAERKNSAGCDLTNENTLREIDDAFAQLGRRQWHAAPLLDGPATGTQVQTISNPADRRDIVGRVIDANAADIETALAAAAACAGDWQSVPPSSRAAALMRASELFETHRHELMALAIREAGKSLPNAIAEVREAVDFLRYYAQQARDTSMAPALGPVLCISPWNFPLAIFTGEISAALAAGNVVLAKPAEQTPLIACRAVELLHQAGVPRSALQLLPGRGDIVGAQLTTDVRVRGVIFTGSTAVAQSINRILAQRAANESVEIPFIAETGGQNAMIVDSSALPEQVVQDAIASAFDSAGQRCSALRVLCLQAEIADSTISMLRGAMQQLRVGNPGVLETDVGPVIDTEAQAGLLQHIDRFKQQATHFYQLPLPHEHRLGTFVAPTLLEIASLSELTHEVFGPVLHVIRYRREDLPQLVEQINASGYGLTLGIHSRIDETIDFIATRAHVGNIYVNRNIVGAVVGVQPFGGEGKSGTGPKAGGPLYLKRLQLDPDPGHLIDDARRMTQATPDAGLAALIAWAGIEGQERLCRLGQQYARTTLLGKLVELPGPTGERNTLSFGARGVILCTASSSAGLLNQCAAALATGNTIAVPRETVALIPASLPTMIRQRIQVLERIDAGASAVRLALAQVPLASVLRIALAANEDTEGLVPVIQTDEERAIPLWRLVAERALSINSSAAGGNASLMTLTG